MGAVGSSHRRSYYPPPSPGVSYPDENGAPQSSDPYTLSGNASEHTPRIVVHGAPYMDRSERSEQSQRSEQPERFERFAVKQHPSTSRSQTHSGLPFTKKLPSQHSRTSFQCNQSPTMQAQQTQTSPPQSPLPPTPAPPYRNPTVETCNCKACREKDAAVATYATASSAANATYVAQNQCPPQAQSKTVAMRTGIPSSTCTGYTKSCGGGGGGGGAVGGVASCGGSSSVYATSQHQQQQQQRIVTDRGGIITTCGAPNCRGHAVDPSLDSAVQPNGQRTNFGFDGPAPLIQLQEPPMGKHSRMQTQHPDPAPYYDRGGSPSGAAPIDVVSEFHHECLEAHNRFRARHQNCSPLSLSSELSKYAQQWAKHLASTGRLEHRQVHTYGENLYTSRGMAVNGTAVVQSWYDEIRYYDFSKPNYKPGTGHFTQIVWRDSRQLGVGIATRGDTTYVVCNYNPPGNIIGSFDSMVPPLR